MNDPRKLQPPPPNISPEQNAVGTLAHFMVWLHSRTFGGLNCVRLIHIENAAQPPLERNANLIECQDGRAKAELLNERRREGVSTRWDPGADGCTLGAYSEGYSAGQG